RRLGGRVRAELSGMVMRCRERARSRRYEPATGLAAALRRSLADEPVLAGPPSAAYRFRKFLRRHKGTVLAGASLVVLLVAGIVGTTLGLVQALAAVKVANGQREKADDERQKAHPGRHPAHERPGQASHANHPKDQS